jgi:hypothetical protein
LNVADTTSILEGVLGREKWEGAKLGKGLTAVGILAKRN